jgi:transposase
VVGLDPQGVRVTDHGFRTSEENLISAFAAIPGEVHVHLEASSLAGWARSVLKPRVARVVVGHPQSNAWIGKDPLKNDRVDAFKLAEFLRLGRVHEVYYPDDPQRAVFKQIVQHYDDLTDQQAREQVKIKARLRAHGILTAGTAPFSSKGREACLARVPSEAAREAIRQLYGLLDQMRQAQRQARRLMIREAQRYSEIARFDKVPGVGLIGACRYSAYVQTPDRFSSKRKLWRYCRLGITDRSSDGKPLGYQAIDRNGNGRLKDFSRKAYQGAMQTRSDNAFKRTYNEALQRKHNETHARLTTQRKIVAVLRAMWKGGADYQDLTG